MSCLRRIRQTCLLMGFLALTSAVPTRGEDDRAIGDQKSELEEIKQEVELGRAKLDSLKGEETRVQDQISDYDRTIAANRRKARELSGNLKQVQAQITDAEGLLYQRQTTYELTRKRFLGDLREFYFVSRRRGAAGLEAPNDELRLRRQVVYLSAVANFKSGTVAAASGYLNESMAQLDQLGSEKDRVSSRKRASETAENRAEERRRREQERLQEVRRRKSEEADHLLMLQQAAREMEDIVARLEQQRKDRIWTEGGPGGERPATVFATLRGHLPPPYSGKIETPFGYAVDPVTNLKSYSPGVTIRGRAGSPVTAVAAGEVAYVGELRGYGTFVIIDHDGQFFTTYAGLADTAVRKGEWITTGTELGRAGETGRVRSELRQGREAKDPLEWIRDDAF